MNWRTSTGLWPSTGRGNAPIFAPVAHAVAEAGAGMGHGVRLVPGRGTGPAWVEMDGVSLRRVIENLVANAVAAARKTNGEVRIGVEAVADSAPPEYRLFVEDDGPGIPAELRPRVFEPFFTTRSEGTGLGLARSRAGWSRMSGWQDHPGERCREGNPDRNDPQDGWRGRRDESAGIDRRRREAAGHAVCV